RLSASCPPSLSLFPLSPSFKSSPAPRPPLSFPTRRSSDLDHFRLTELTRTTRLLLVGVGDFDFTGEALAIRHLRCTNVGLNLELAPHAIDEDVEVKLAHALDDRLARFMVGRDAERRILGSQARQGNAHLLLVGFGLRLHRQLDDRIRKLHTLQNDRV